jgi:hypothetical protein
MCTRGKVVKSCPVTLPEQSLKQCRGVNLHLRLASYTLLDVVALVGRHRREPLPRGGYVLTYYLAYLVGRRLPMQVSTFPLIAAWSKCIVR